MVIAMKNGMMTSISEVSSGLTCECTCPCCGRKLVARKGTLKAHHFAHHAGHPDESCNFAAETILHQFAKQVIEEERRIGIPAVAVEDEYGPLTVTTAKTVRLDEVVLERGFRSVVPDVSCRAGDRVLLVEFFVTHKCSDRKIAKLAEMDVAVMEVDLSKFRYSALSELREIILTKAPRVMLFGRQFDKGADAFRTTVHDGNAPRRPRRRTAKASRLRQDSD